jgi:hypothetical protein
MHRSGTSLVANLFQAAGVDLGETLVPGDPGNPRGHFEAANIVAFHKQILHRWGYDILVPNHAWGDLTAADKEAAQSLIKNYSTAPMWGWKDPRTCLFLALWAELLPQAKFLFIYRHPLEVTLSLVRRGSDFEALVNPDLALQSWHVYNQAILKFQQAYPERCLLADIRAIVPQIDSFMAQVAAKFSLPLVTTESNKLYHQAELQQPAIPLAINQFLMELAPEMMTTYQQLIKQADFASIATSEASALPELTQLVTLWHGLSPDLQPAARNAMVSLLLIFLDPKTMRAWPDKTQTAIAEWRKNYTWLADQWEQHYAWITYQTAQIEQLRQQEQTLLIAQNNLRAEREQWQQLAHYQQRQLRQHPLLRLLHHWGLWRGEATHE